MADKSQNKDRSNLMYELLDEAVNGLLSKLKQTACEHCDARAASAQDFSNVIKFLKDNGFTIEPEKATSALSKILQHMEKRGEYPDTTQPS